MTDQGKPRRVAFGPAMVRGYGIETGHWDPKGNSAYTSERLEYDVDLRDTIPSPVPTPPLSVATLAPKDRYHTHTGFRDLTPFERAVNAPPDSKVAFERGLTRFLLGALALACICLAAALLTSCAGPQLPRTEAERVTYCAHIAQAREDVARYADTEDARWAFNAQLDEQAEAGGCRR